MKLQMHFFKISVCILFCIIYWAPLAIYAQNDVDSVKVTGKLIWQDTTIKGFPKKVKIISRYNPLFVSSAEVDSLGNYSTVLPADSYMIAPAVPYHYYDAFIRIDTKQSKLFCELKDNKEMVLPALKIDTLGKTGYIPEKGILHGDFTTEKIKKIDAFVETTMAYYHVPGASLAVIKNGNVIHNRVYGVENFITHEPVNENTLFEAGSVTKPVFAYAVMRLVEKGIIDLDKPLYEYLPFEDVAHDDRYKRITARLILSHQSGFPNWAERNDNGQFDLLFTPGTQFGYSGEGFEYLKRVAEHVTQKDIGTILKEEVLVPLNWNDVYFKTTEEVKQRISNGQSLKGFPSRNSRVKNPMMAYSMVVEAQSFVNFALGLRNRKGLRSDTYDEMLKIHSTEEDGFHWGLGVHLEETNLGIAYGHSGYMPSSGFLCNFIFFPELDMGYVMFTNSTTGWWLTIELLKEFLITGKGNS